MKVEYVAKDTSNVVDDIEKQISDKDATIISRLKSEVAAAIPSSDGIYTFVYLTRLEGAHISAFKYKKRALAKMLHDGDWRVQPNAKIVLDESLILKG